MRAGLGGWARCGAAGMKNDGSDGLIDGGGKEGRFLWCLRRISMVEADIGRCQFRGA